MKYIRKVQSIGRWDGTQDPLYEGAFSSGDILLGDLRTENNTLSIWSYNTEEEKNEVLAAIALTRDHVEKLAYVELDDAYINNLEIPITPEAGIADGVIKQDILDRHANLSKIDFWRIGYVAEYLSKYAADATTHNQISKRKVFNIIKEQIDKRNIDFTQMRPLLQESFSKMV